MSVFDLWLAGIPNIGRKMLYVLWRQEGSSIRFAENLYYMEEGLLHPFVERAVQEENRKRYREEREQFPAAMVKRTVNLLREARRAYAQQANLERLAQEYHRQGIRYIWAGEPDYPERLKKIEDPPFGLYVKGRLPEERKPTVGIVGTRMASAYGRMQARHFAASLAAEGVQIISGMARGIDGIAGRGALDEGDDSFAVLGGGVDVCYPKENRDLYEALADRGGLISEYRPGLQPQNRFFPSRNRIISGLSDILLVIEARERSGTLITVDRALEQGKDVWALPGRIDDRNSAGCNELIRQGAGIALSPEMLLESLGIREEGRTPAKGTEQASFRAEDVRHETAAFRSEIMRHDLEDSEEVRRMREENARPPMTLNEAILQCLDRSTPHSLDDIFGQVIQHAARKVTCAEMQRELTRMILRGEVYEIRVGQYVKG